MIESDWHGIPETLVSYDLSVLFLRPATVKINTPKNCVLQTLANQIQLNYFGQSDWQPAANVMRGRCKSPSPARRGYDIRLSILIHETRPITCVCNR
jgi:hypothetical protein